MFRNEEKMEICLFLNLVLFWDVMKNNNKLIFKTFFFNFSIRDMKYYI